MAKNLIIGAFTGYTYNQLKPWVESIDTCGFVGDKVMIVGIASEETKSELEKRGFKLVLMENNPHIPIHVARFMYIYDYLRSNDKKYNMVVTTDVKDVYFQKDPCKWLTDNLGSKHLAAGSESIRYKDEAWGNENLMQCYGPYIHDIFKNNIIYNVGTFGGECEYVKDMCFNIFTNAVNRPIPIVDQAVYNVLINTQPYKDAVLFANQEDGYAVQLGTTGDPSKMDTFRPHLVEAEPIFDFESELVTTSKGTPHCIVHQYDRVPKWKELVMKKFNQEDPDKFFVYRT